MIDAVWQLESAGLGGRRGRGFVRLSDVNISIKAGTTAVLGSSGAGKTSLLNLLVGFEKPDKGRVVFHPPVLNEQHDGAGGSAAVFWSPQDAGLWPHLSLREHLEAVRPGRRIKTGGTPVPPKRCWRRST